MRFAGKMRLVWLTALFLIVTPVRAAEIQRQLVDGMGVIVVAGVINKGDDLAFRDLAATASRDTIVVLNCEGGLVQPALEIGKAIRLKGLATAVAPDELCASACALIWLAGIDRYMGTKSHIGFHASYRLVNREAQVSDTSNALVGAYLNQLSLPENAIVFVTTAPPEGMEWLTPESASAAGITFRSLDADRTSLSVGNTDAQNDPLKVVFTFYSALSVADGETAAALVIPDKRGKGPFNERNIHSFFSSLERPLRLRGANLKGDDLVEVTYDYVKAGGAVCNGKANVKTTYAFGKTLITGIKALSGC